MDKSPHVDSVADSVADSELHKIDMRRHQTTGLIFGLSAFVMWALMPIFYKEIDHVPNMEVLANRMIWSFVFLTIMLFFRRDWPTLKKDVCSVLGNVKLMKLLLISAVLITVNWLVFIWAVASNHVVETSLGYFINPLISVLLGVIFLGERLDRVKMMAVVLAALGVVYMVVMSGTFPWIALSLAFTFGLYGLTRKKAMVGAVLGLWVEMLMLVPLALIYLLYYRGDSIGGFGDYGSYVESMLILSGIVTTVPLMFFNGATKRLTLTTVGLIQYVAPTGTLLLAVYLWNEPFTEMHIVGFSFIWTGLLVYTLGGLYGAAKRRRA